MVFACGFWSESEPNFEILICIVSSYYKDPLWIIIYVFLELVGLPVVHRCWQNLGHTHAPITCKLRTCISEGSVMPFTLLTPMCHDLSPVAWAEVYGHLSFECIGKTHFNLSNQSPLNGCPYVGHVMGVYCEGPDLALYSARCYCRCQTFRQPSGCVSV